MAQTTLRIERPDGSLVPLRGGDDPSSSNDYSLEVQDGQALAALLDLIAAVGGTVTVDGTVELGPTALASLAALLGAVDDIEASLTALLAVVAQLEVNTTGLASQATQASILAAVDTLEDLVAALGAALGPLATQATLAALAADVADGIGVTGPITNEEFRASPPLVREVAVTPYAESVTGPVTDEILVAVAPGTRMRLRKFQLHADPALAEGTFPVVTLKLGAVVVFSDKFEPGLPYAEGIPIEGADGADLTVSVSLAATVFVNVRYELF